VQQQHRTIASTVVRSDDRPAFRADGGMIALQ
jgi:hypothetical protein